MNKHIAPVLAAVAALGVVGGVAAAQAFQPAEKPAPVVRFAPAAETSTVAPAPAPVPTTTTVAPAPKPVVKKAAPAPAPVESTQAPAPAPVQTQETTVPKSQPAPAAEPAPAPPAVIPPLNNHTVPDSTPGQTGVFGGGSGETAPASPKGH